MFHLECGKKGLEIVNEIFLDRKIYEEISIILLN